MVPASVMVLVNCDVIKVVSVQLTGLLVREVSDEEDLLTLLAKGALSRTTGATAMNSVSSRSHAIFTIHVERTNKHDR